jgi:hypothetical protein
MNAGNPARAGFGMQAVGEGRADRQDTATGPLACLEHDDRPTSLSKKVSGAQTGKTGAHHDDGSAGGRSFFDESLYEGRSRKGRDLEKPPAREVPGHRPIILPRHRRTTGECRTVAAQCEPQTIAAAVPVSQAPPTA